MKAPFLSVTNHHHESCGVPPIFQSGNGYLSYFEGIHRDQWVFAMDWETKVFFVCGGDCDWGNKFIGEDGLKSLVLDMAEQFWAIACLQACGLADVAARVLDAWAKFQSEVLQYSK